MRSRFGYDAQIIWIEKFHPGGATLEVATSPKWPAAEAKIVSAKPMHRITTYPGDQQQP